MPFDPCLSESPGELYFHGLLDFEDDLYSALRLKHHFRTLTLSLRERMALLLDALRLPGRLRLAALTGEPRKGDRFTREHSKASDRAAVSFHYDLSNELYRRIYLLQGRS